MRRVVGYDQGRAIWSDPEPSEFPEEMPRLMGSFVQGEPGPVEKARQQSAADRARVKADPDRYARRQATWHASKVRSGKAAA